MYDGMLMMMLGKHLQALSYILAALRDGLKYCMFVRILLVQSLVLH